MDHVIDALTEVLGGAAVSTGLSDRETHAQDESTQPAVVPLAVVYPRSTRDVSRIAEIANANLVPITGWGAGTSVEGNAVPSPGGIVVDFREMNQIVALHVDDFQATVQPGILRLDLEDQLRQHGLFFPPDPGANASIGGMIANNAAGIRTVKYGATRDNVLGLTVVLADGRVIKAGSRSIKQSAGYDLRHLMIGSEGTLGLVTEATLKLATVPEHWATAVVAFRNVGDASAVVRSIMGYGLEPAALELVHQNHVQWMNEDEGTGLVEAPSLMIEFSGPTAQAVEESMREALSICDAVGVIDVRHTSDHAERAEMWRMRHGSRERYVRRNPGRRIIAVDAAVPISAFPELMSFVEATTAGWPLDVPIIGHAGDGNIHVSLIFDPADAEAAAAAQQMSDEIVHRAIEMGGTSTGEHGVGVGKRKYLVDEFGADTVDVMRAIKRTLDPNGILNPGKVIPD